MGASGRRTLDVGLWVLTKARPNQCPLRPDLLSPHTFVMSTTFWGPSIYQVPSKLPVCDWQGILSKPVCPPLCLHASPSGQEWAVLSRGSRTRPPPNSTLLGLPCPAHVEGTEGKLGPALEGGSQRGDVTGCRQCDPHNIRQLDLVADRTHSASLTVTGLWLQGG